MKNERDWQRAYESKYSDQSFILRGFTFYFKLIEKYFGETISLLKTFGVGKTREWQASKGEKNITINSACATGYILKSKTGS